MHILTWERKVMKMLSEDQKSRNLAWKPFGIITNPSMLEQQPARLWAESKTHE